MPTQPSSQWTGRPDPKPNFSVCHILSHSNATMCGVNGSDVPESRTDLDSHANMVVMGKHSYILSRSGRTAEVSPFSPSYEALSAVPIVDAAVAYDCPYSGKTYILVCQNALSIPEMEHNLVPPFIMREANIVVNDTPKIQVATPTENDHSIYFPDARVRIPLSLWGVFSYFPTRRPTIEELRDSEDILLLTPEGRSWDPHSDVYARNEENMLDWEGNMVEPKSRPRILLEDLPDFEAEHVASVSISAVESKAVDDIFSAASVDCCDNYVDTVPGNRTCDSVYANLSTISSSLDPMLMVDLMTARREIGIFAMSIGSTRHESSRYLFDNDDDDDDSMLDLDEMIDSATRLTYPEQMEAGGTHASRSQGVSPEFLAKIWRIDLKDAQRTLNVTSQLLKRSDDPSLSRNYTTNDRMLRYHRIHQYFFTDTFFATKKAGKTSRGFTCMQLFVTDKGFVHVVPMRSKGEVPQAMKLFAKEIGAPDAFVCDAAREQVSAEVRSFCHKIGTSLRILEEGTPWANRAELYIGLLKEAIRQDMKASGSPLAFWDYCAERRARINNLTARDLFQLEGRNPHFTVTGEEGDISNLCQFDWYEWCYYREHTGNFPFDREILGRVLGPAKGEGNEMAQWILKSNGNVVPRRTVRPLNVAEKNSPREQKKRDLFDAAIAERWGNALIPEATKDEVNDDDEWEPVEPKFTRDFDDPVDHAGRAIDQQPAYDKLIHSEVVLPQGQQLRMAKVSKRTVGPDGRTIGTYDENPLRSTMVYDVEFPDGEVKEYAANVIAENLLSQVDSEGFTLSVFDSIVAYSKDSEAVEKENMYAVTEDGRRRMRKTTSGWKLLVRWKDATQSWVPLRDMKESHPVEVAEFAKARKIDREPAFAWWVPYTLRKRDTIISAVKARIRRTTHKYGVEIPRDVRQAHALDKANGNDLWKKAIQKEMTNVGVAFEILEDDQNVPVGWSKQSGHLVFDVKMDLTRKARWVLDGHRTADPECSTYAGVVSRESVRIALTYAALNDIPVVAADIQNAYLQSPSSQKHYIICGEEFGLENIGKKALIRRALYGGKSAGRDFRNHLRACMDHLGFKSCPADPDVWMRPAIKADGSQCWEYVLLYTDDVLVISEQGEHILRQEIGKYFVLKPESIGPPKIYLGGQLRLVTLENGAKAWAVSSSKYTQAAVKNVEQYLTQRGEKMSTKATTPLSNNYRPEVDVTPELSAEEAAYYQSLIGVLRWIVELGRVDICLEVSMMSSHLALPREGHLQQLYHIFAYLKKHHNAEMVFDPSDPVVDESMFSRRDWTTSEFGLSLTEDLPDNMPEPRGFGFTMRAFVDADHAGDSVTRRSRTGFLVYLNSAPIYWLSKKQSGVETSSFGSEFIAMKQCCEYLRGLRYKLRMMGIPCVLPSYVYGDNQSVLANTTVPESTLKKKSQSIAYHFVREGCARDEWRTTYVNTHLNPADLLTKPLPSGEKRVSFVRMILHHVFGEVE